MIHIYLPLHWITQNLTLLPGKWLPVSVFSEYSALETEPVQTHHLKHSGRFTYKQIQEEMSGHSIIFMLFRCGIIKSIVLKSVLPPTPSSWMTDPTQALTNHMAILFFPPSNSCDSWLYSRSRWSAAYFCRGSLVLPPRCSAPPPLFPGGDRRGETWAAEKNKRSKSILGASRCLYSHRFSPQRIAGFWGLNRCSPKGHKKSVLKFRWIKTWGLKGEDEEKWLPQWGRPLTSWGLMVVSRMSWICLRSSASFWSSLFIPSSSYKQTAEQLVSLGIITYFGCWDVEKKHAQRRDALVF